MGTDLASAAPRTLPGWLSGLCLTTLAIVLAAESGCTPKSQSVDIKVDIASQDALSADTAELPVDPTWAVATWSADWTDTARSTPANGDAAAHAGRHLPVQVWYPTEQLAGQSAAMLAPVAKGVFGVVLFVHGSSGTPKVYSGLCKRLAAFGYIVVAADFPLTSLLTDGGPSDWHVADQTGDLRFLADQVLGTGIPAWLAGHVDPAAGYAVVGHSTGGTVALLAAYRSDEHDKRLRAVVDMSGDSCFFAPEFFATRSVPLLAMGATLDALVPAANNPARAFEFAQEPAFLVLLRGGTHLQMTDMAMDDPADASPTGLDDPLAQTLAAWGVNGSCRPVPPLGNDPQLGHDQQRDLAAQVSALFLKAYLSGMHTPFQAWLQNPGALVTVQYKP